MAAFLADRRRMGGSRSTTARLGRAGRYFLPDPTQHVIAPVSQGRQARTVISVRTCPRFCQSTGDCDWPGFFRLLSLNVATARHTTDSQLKAPVSSSHREVDSGRVGTVYLLSDFPIPSLGIAEPSANRWHLPYHSHFLQRRRLNRVASFLHQNGECLGGIHDCFTMTEVPSMSLSSTTPSSSCSSTAPPKSSALLELKPGVAKGKSPALHSEVLSFKKIFVQSVAVGKGKVVRGHGRRHRSPARLGIQSSMSREGILRLCTQMFLRFRETVVRCNICGGGKVV